MQHAPMAPRTAHVRRETRESRIEVALNLDGSGRGDIATGIGFLDHMLDSLARHARFDLTVRAEATFKALARALDDATRPDPRLAGEIPSTKGVI